MKIKLPKVPGPVLKVVGRPTLLAKAHSPEILLAAGVAGVVTSAVWACKSTLKVNDVLDEAGETKDKIEVNAGVLEGYSATDATRDLAVLKVQTAQKLVRLYVGPIALGVVSIGALIGSNRILSTRNAGLAAAYTALDKGFQQYRDRIKVELGADREKELYYGSEPVTVKDKDGKKHQVVGGPSIYAKVFDESNVNWQRTPHYNQMFIQAQQNYANDLLRSRGHVFLNEVYSMLGLEHTGPGAVVGWVKGNGDDYIDFGVFQGNEYSALMFVNGDEDSVWLDFNVDGVIYYMLDK